MRLASPAVLLAALFLLVPPPAKAEDVSRATLARLAAQATDNPDALERLLRVDSVGGVPVDLRAALSGSEGAELAERLEVLDDIEEARTAEPDAAREEASEILSERRFRGTELPRPFRGVLGWIGEQLRPVGGVIERLAGRLPGGRSTLWVVLGILVLTASALVSLDLARRRSARAFTTGRAGTRETRADPARLEREAEEAERRGELEVALRLRFRAGLLRLDRLEAIEYRDSLTSGEVARRIRSPAFERLARSFDEVVYGRRPAGPDDVASSRRGWPSVLTEVRPP